MMLRSPSLALAVIFEVISIETGCRSSIQYIVYWAKISLELHFFYLNCNKLTWRGRGGIKLYIFSKKRWCSCDACLISLWLHMNISCLLIIQSESSFSNSIFNNCNIYVQSAHKICRQLSILDDAMSQFFGHLWISKNRWL